MCFAVEVFERSTNRCQVYLVPAYDEFSLWFMFTEADV